MIFGVLRMEDPFLCVLMCRRLKDVRMKGDFKYEIFEMCLISRSEFDVGKRWEFESEKGGKW